MQWLIDIIKEIIHGQLGFFDRGDPATPDYQKADLVLDGNWHTLDLSSVLPADTKGFSLRATFRTGVVGSGVRFRTPGNVNVENVSYAIVQVAGVLSGYDFTLACDSDRHIEFWASNVVWLSLNLIVKAWWLR